MKYFILILGYIFLTNIANGQCDIAQTGLTPSASTIGVGQTLDISFTIINVGGDPTCAYPLNSVEAILSLPTNVGFVSIQSPAGGVGSFFTWTYDPAEHVIYGINNISPIGWLQGENNVTVRFEGLSAGSGPFIISLIPVGTSNNTTNDESLPFILSVGPLPITLSSFTGTSVDCDHVSLQWETASEINNEYMEILRSSDGKEFLSIGKVAGTNAAGGSKYSIEDQNYLLPNGKYYYVLRQVDFDGKMTHHDMIVVKHHCDEVVKSFAIYPNPAVEKISLAVEGFESPQDMSIHILNADGGLVRSMQVNTGLVNEINIDDLPSGVYQIQGLGDSALSGRFIKIK